MAEEWSLALPPLQQVNMFESVGDVHSEQYVLALDNYGLARGDFPQQWLEILERAKSLAQFVGLQSTNSCKGMLANIERARSEANVDKREEKVTAFTNQ